VLRPGTPAALARLGTRHPGLGSLGSRRLNELLRTVLAEIRLAVRQTKQDLRRLYEPYVAWNREFLVLMQKNEIARAEGELVHYFEKSERDLMAALAAVQQEQSIAS
jgi:hypothetical protein